LIKEFKCKDCGKIIEVWERFDKTPECCGTCGGEIKQIISQTSFSLKGKGWAFDGYGGSEVKYTPSETENN